MTFICKFMSKVNKDLVENAIFILEKSAFFMALRHLSDIVKPWMKTAVLWLIKIHDDFLLTLTSLIELKGEFET